MLDLIRPRGPVAALAALAVVALGAALALAPSAAHAQPSDDEIGDTQPFLALFPTLRTRPAPSWIAPGVRVTYRSAAAAAAGGASGAGVIQYDIAARDATQVLAYQTMYGDDGLGPYALATGAVRGYPGLGLFWIDPGVLVGAESLAGPDLSITRYDKTLDDGTLFHVIRFQATGAGTTVWEFDSETGVLVFDSQTGNGGANQTTLVDIRVLPLPWGSSRAPNWVRSGAELDYSGSKATTIPAAGTVQQPITIDIRVSAAGARWSLLTLASTLNGASQGTGPGLTGEGQLVGGLWLPRSALALNLGAPALVDTDPVTGAQVYFGKDQGSIVIQRLTAASRTTWLYDPTLGALTRLVDELATPAASFVADVSLTGGSDLAALATQPELPEDPTTAPTDPTDPTDPTAPTDPAGNGGGAVGRSAGCAGAGADASWWIVGLALAARAFSAGRGSRRARG